MPILQKVISETDLHSASAPAGDYLAPYADIIEQIVNERGVGGALTLSKGESQRVEKRRLSVAAKQAGHTLKWRKSAAGTLRFVLDGAGARKRSRPRIVDAERELMAV